MSNLKSLSVLGLLIFIQFPGVSSAQSQEDILEYIPGDANMLSVLNVESLVASPLGVKEGWGEKHKQNHLDGSLTIPPWVKHFVQASQFNPGKRGDLWNATFSPLGNDFDFETVAKRAGVEVQEIRDTPAVLSSRWQGYFVELHPNEFSPDQRMLALIRGVSRQEVSNWIGKAGNNNQLSNYLRQAVADKKPQMIIAYDMNDMFDPTQVSYRLNGATALKGHPLELATLKLTFQTLKGVRIAVTVENEINCEIQLDFIRSLGAEAKYIQPMLVEFMQDAGAELEEIATAKPTVLKHSYILKTPLSQASFRKLLSLISTPHPTVEADPTPTASSSDADSDTPDMLASKRYYDAVLKNLNDLERAYLSKKQSYGRSAVWHRTFADRIQHLPQDRVHPDLIKFADSMADHLRQLSISLSGTNIETSQMQREVRTSTEYKYHPRTGFEWWWGPARTAYGYVRTPSNTDVIVHSNLDQVRAKQYATANKEDKQREEVWRAMAKERDAVHKHMVMVFGRTF